MALAEQTPQKEKTPGLESPTGPGATSMKLAIFKVDSLTNYTGTTIPISFTFLCWDKDPAAKQICEKTIKEGFGIWSILIPIDNRKDTELDSIEIGTPGKTGVIKIYYDSSQTSKEEMERRIINAVNYLTITKGLLKTE
jgi:hypothetical protein